MARVLLISMPFGSLRWPSLALGLLKAELAERDIACDVAYLGFDFAERIGLDLYNWIGESFAFVLGGDRLFAAQAFDADRLPTIDLYYEEILHATDRDFSREEFAEFLSVGHAVGPFLDQCMSSIPWEKYTAVGFTTSLQQTVASMALADRIKRRHPEIAVVFGGSACEGPMGTVLLEESRSIDYVFSGEADRTFGELTEQLLRGERPNSGPGYLGREPRVDSTMDSGHCQEPTQVIEDLDELPYPDFDDYFHRLEASLLQDDIHPLLMFETSRGCWWGQKHHCKFCGLNGGAMEYRSKSPGRSVDELCYLVSRHKVDRACAADNILDYRYFDSFLPLLSLAGLDLKFVFEMKTNLNRDQVLQLVDAGLGAAQLGIETFSTPILRIANKGASAIQNLQALKWFAEAGVEVKWNFLYGFPGEPREAYSDLEELLPQLAHLPPPVAVGPVRLDRFSPYYENPTENGIARVRVDRAFAHVYPYPEEKLRRLAYYFEFDHADGRNPIDYATPVLDLVESWQGGGETVTLRYMDREDGVLIITDTRPVATAFQHRLTGLDREVYLYCDAGRSRKRLVEWVGTHAEGLTNVEAYVRSLLDRLIGDRLVVRLDDRYLALATRGV